MSVVLETWKNADAVCFDVDSTVCEDEGIDELAEFCGAGEIVSQWTRKYSLLCFIPFTKYVKPFALIPLRKSFF